MTSQIEQRIGGLIRQQFPMHIIERNSRPEWLRPPDGHCLELDFYLPELSLAFEVQGKQHYVYTPLFHATIDDFRDQLKRDKIKRAMCKDHGVYLIEVASANEYSDIQHHIVDALQQSEHKRMTDYILKRAAQVLTSIINLTINIQNMQTGEKLSKTARRNKNTLAELIYNREMNREMLRYISIRAIQDFYGLVSFYRPNRIVALKQLRSQGKYPSHRKEGRHPQRGLQKGMKRFA